MSVLRDTERMHARSVSNIHVMIFHFFSLSVLVNCFEHVTGLWFKMDRSGNVCKHSFVFMQFRNDNNFFVSHNRNKAVI